MKTFILEWRPAISSFKEEDFQDELKYMENSEFNWSVFDWKNARSGDNFYLIKCGEGKTGIVMKGFFTSEPYIADDWSGMQREVHYMEMRPTVMIHYDNSKGIITTRELEEAMPDFEWNGGHSGRELSEEYAKILDEMWDSYIEKFSKMDFDCKMACKLFRPEAGIDDAVGVAQDGLYDIVDEEGQPMILKALSLGLAGRNEKEKICGFLSLLLNHSEYSAGEIRERGFTEDIIDTLMESSNK